MWFPGTKLFKLVEVHLGDGLSKLQDTQPLHLKELSTVNVDSFHGLERYFFVFNLKRYLSNIRCPND